jgi:signal-transduction protein with cAMP-binding, CBS, and nucleotidyltransferase domain
METKEYYPTIYLNFKKKMKEYEDFDFNFRRKMIKNVPYFRILSDDVIEELVYSLTAKRFETDTVIINSGDIVDKLMFLKSGVLSVSVPLLNSPSIFLDTLNEGSCFCIYTAHSPDL